MKLAHGRTDKKPLFEGARVLILTGDFVGENDVCLGSPADSAKWDISPDGSDAILEMEFEKEFGLLIDLSADPSKINELTGPESCSLCSNGSETVCVREMPAREFSAFPDPAPRLPNSIKSLLICPTHA